MTVLLVEDDTLVRHALKIVIEIEDIDVIDVRDGEQAMTVLGDRDIDVVVTDIFMPEMEGMELIRRMKDEHPDIPVIAISGGGSVDNVDYLDAAVGLGAEAVFSKPFDERDLIAKIVELRSDPAP